MMKRSPLIICFIVLLVGFGILVVELQGLFISSEGRPVRVDTSFCYLNVSIVLRYPDTSHNITIVNASSLAVYNIKLTGAPVNMSLCNVDNGYQYALILSNSTPHNQFINTDLIWNATYRLSFKSLGLETALNCSLIYHRIEYVTLSRTVLGTVGGSLFVVLVTIVMITTRLMDLSRRRRYSKIIQELGLTIEGIRHAPRKVTSELLDSIRSGEYSYTYWMAVGHLRMIAGDFDNATFAFEIASQINPSSVEPRLELARIAKDSELSMQILLDAAEDAPSNPEAHFLLGLVLLKLDEFQEAEEALNRALELNGCNPKIWEALAFLYTITDRPENAREAYLQAAKCSGPHNSPGS